MAPALFGFKKRRHRAWQWMTLMAMGFAIAHFVTPMVQADQATPAPTTAPAAASATPSLPTYFSGSSADSAKPIWPDPTGGAAGAWATPAGDGKGDDPGKFDLAPTCTTASRTTCFSINIVWVMIAGFLVMFMQAGFAMVETGLCRAKNSAHTMSMNLLVYPLGCFAFFAYGWAIGWGNWFNGPVGPGWYSTLGPGTSILNGGWGIGADPNAAGAFKYGIIGTKGFFLSGMDDVSVLALFFFMMVFMDTTATIPTGAMAERWSWKNFCIYGLWVALPYCLFANWVWGGGWLAQAGKNWSLGHGAVDFAGSGVVHAMGGVIGLAGCDGHRAADRQVRRWQATGHSGAPHPDGCRRHVHPGVWVGSGSTRVRRCQARTCG